MLPKTGTIVSLTGYFFPTQVRLVDRGDTIDEAEELDTNDKPYGVKVIIPHHLSEMLPNPDDTDTDKVYFAHVMGHHFEAAVFDPVNPLQPFGNQGRMHINAICFDIARCMLPTDLYSIYASQGGTMAYEEISNFCNSCRNTDIPRKVVETPEPKSVLDDASFNEDDINSSQDESPSSDESIIIRRNRRTRISSIRSSGSSSVKVSSDSSSDLTTTTDRRGYKKMTKRTGSKTTIVLPPINISNNHNHTHHNQLNVKTEKTLWQANNHQHNFNANINFQLQNNFNVAVNNQLNVIKNNWHTIQNQYNQFEQNNRLNINNTLVGFQKNRNSVILKSLKDVQSIDNDALITIENQLNSDKADETEEPTKAIDRLSNNHQLMANKFENYGKNNSISETDKLILSNVVSALKSDLPTHIKDLFDARSEIHIKYLAEAEKFETECQNIVAQYQMDISAIDHQYTAQINADMNSQVRKIDGDLTEQDKTIEEKATNYFNNELTNYQHHLFEEFNIVDKQQNDNIIDRVTNCIIAEKQNILTSSELTNSASKGVKTMEKMLKTTTRLHNKYEQKLKQTDKQFNQEKENFQKMLKKGKYKAYIEGKNVAIKEITMMTEDKTQKQLLHRNYDEPCGSNSRHITSDELENNEIHNKGLEELRESLKFSNKWD